MDFNDLFDHLRRRGALGRRQHDDHDHHDDHGSIGENGLKDLLDRAWQGAPKGWE
jgi:hypothetical protein